jgi:hypothetical protein
LVYFRTIVKCEVLLQPIQLLSSFLTSVHRGTDGQGDLNILTRSDNYMYHLLYHSKAVNFIHIVRMYICIYVYMYVCMNVCMYVCASNDSHSKC